jgi:hypothetical protein
VGVSVCACVWVIICFEGGGLLQVEVLLVDGCERSYVCMLGWPEPYLHGVHTVFWQGIHQIYGLAGCVCTVLANPVCCLVTLFLTKERIEGNR